MSIKPKEINEFTEKALQIIWDNGEEDIFFYDDLRGNRIRRGLRYKVYRRELVRNRVLHIRFSQKEPCAGQITSPQRKITPARL